ncbi:MULTISPECIES: hypothetical protein [unclassified Streptomyces]|uniref:hypothetical protein n=1 Tax=unclassified Streptomyces TaxID=2593676 RepID=UPI0037F88730
MSAVDVRTGSSGGRGTSGGPARPRPRSGRVLRTELIRGIGPATGAAIAVVVCIAMFAKAPAWQSRWTDTTDLLRIAGLLLGGPLAAAAGCRQGSRERRLGLRDLLATTPRPALRRTLLAAAPAALWPVAGYLLAAAVSLLATLPFAGYGHPFGTLLLADAVALGAMGLLGFVVGRMASWRLLPLLVAVITYVVLGLPSYLTEDARWLGPVQEHTFAWDRPQWWFGPASAVWTAGLAAAALLALAARRRATAVIPLALAVAAAVPVARTGDGLWRPDPGAARPVCDTGVPKVCVSAADSKALAAVSQALTGVRGQLRGVPGAPTRWVEGPAPLGPHDARLADLGDGMRHGELRDPARYAHNAVANLFVRDCPADTGTDDAAAAAASRAYDVDGAVVQWLAPQPGFEDMNGEGARTMLRHLREKDAAERRAYLTRYLAADRCDLKAVPVP